MPIRVSINGFGRIGRLVLRAMLESRRDDIEVVAINDLGPVETNAHLLRYDSVHGTFNGEVKTTDGAMDAGRGWMTVTAERDPAKLPWGKLGVDVALECTGLFTDREKAKAHLTAGAKRVLISAPGDQCRSDGGLWRQPRQAGEEPHHRLQRLLHDQLPGARRRGAAQGRRDRAWLHDHHPQLYRRSAGARHPAQGSLPRPRRGALDDPHHHGGGEGRRPRPAGARRQARRQRRSGCRRPMSR